MIDRAVIERGYASCQRVTRRHAKSFFFASFALFGARRRAAFALYAFCRRLDDLVDEGPREGLEGRLSRARALIGALYADDAALERVQFDTDTWLLEELCAVRDAIRRFDIPEAPLQHLVSGMEMDLVGTHYGTYATLLLYCYRVAGTVGLLLAPVLGCRDARALPAADALGRAMQLTNILRDIREDHGRGRLYLAEEDLVRFGVDDAAIASGRMTDGLRQLIREYIARARGLYAEAAVGIGALSLTGRIATRLMGEIYGALLDELEAKDLDVFSGRIHVPLTRKLAIAARTIFGAARVLKANPPRRPSLVQGGA